MLTVACVLSEGPKREYTREHVDRLARMVDEHMAQPFVFYCLDDSPLPGWWAKISLFDGHLKGRVLYLDLDVTVAGSLDDLANFDAPFVIIDDWNRPGYNSSAMAWDAGAADQIYNAFTSKVMQDFAGDQNWIEACMPDAATFPPAWCRSYKKSIAPRLNDSVPDDCRVIVYHGAPKSWDLPDVD